MADPKLIDLDPLTIAELEALSIRVGQEIARKRQKRLRKSACDERDRGRERAARNYDPAPR